MAKTKSKELRQTTIDPRRFYIFHVLSIFMIIVLLTELIHHHVLWYSVVVVFFLALMEFSFFMYRKKGLIKPKH